MIRQIVLDWKQFFFAPRSNQDVVLPRCVLCLVTGIWILSFWASLPIWFGPHGVLSPKLSATLIDFEQLAHWQLWSPLWMIDSVSVYYVWLALGVLLCVLGALGLGGRWTFGLLVLWIIAWTHRILWLAGVVEPALVALTAYFLIEPGPLLLSWGTGPSRIGRAREFSWTAQTTLRLLQTHWWILVAVGLLSQLASLIWWRGEAVWWLASASKSTVLTRDLLTDRPLMVNGLTHGIIVVQMLALWLITLRSTRLIGMACGLTFCLAAGLVADMTLYALVLGSALIAFWPDSLPIASRE